MNWQYPKVDGLAKDGSYVIGDASESACMSWGLASAYLISSPLGRVLKHSSSCIRSTQIDFR